MKMLFLLMALAVSLPVFSQWDEAFETRLSSSLSIAGMRCQGGEKSGVSDRICEKDQWLIILDQAEDFEAMPFIAKLHKVSMISPRNTEYFEIIPKDTVLASQRRLLGRYWVKFDLNYPPEVQWRCGK